MNCSLHVMHMEIFARGGLKHDLTWQVQGIGHVSQIVAGAMFSRPCQNAGRPVWFEGLLLRGRRTTFGDYKGKAFWHACIHDQIERSCKGVNDVVAYEKKRAGARLHEGYMAAVDEDENPNEATAKRQQQSGMAFGRTY